MPTLDQLCLTHRYDELSVRGSSSSDPYMAAAAELPDAISFWTCKATLRDRRTSPRRAKLHIPC